VKSREKTIPFHAVLWSVIFVMATIAVAHAEVPAPAHSLRPNDPLFPKQEPLFNRINVWEAWEITKGDPNVSVGVIDIGFDFFHPDLKANLLPGFFASGKYHAETFETVGHGTLVASLIAAVSDNGIGMTGLAPNCRILTASQGMIEHPLVKLQKKFRQEHPEAGPREFAQALGQEKRAELKSFSTDWTRFVNLSTAESIRYLVDRKVRVINISELLRRSLCPVDTWQVLEDAFAYARQKGVIIVLGAGNNAALCEDYPGNEDSVIVVGATRMDDTRWEEMLDLQGTKIRQGSNFGKRLTVMAPTENLQVCMPHDPRFYNSADGPMGPTKVDFKDPYGTAPQGATSSAAPLVTSLVALVYSIRPDFNASAVIDAIKQGCDDIGANGYDIHTGFGRVNFGKTIRIAMARKK
jgi:subtilisin family serine protease